MKAYTFKFGPILTLCLLFFSLGFISCENDDVDALPVVERVRLLDPNTADSSITAALPGTLIVIQGNHFHDIHAIYFNEIAADFNPALSSSQNLIVAIPADAPSQITDPSVTNTLRIKTGSREITHSFEILSPAPIIDGLYCEFVTAGGITKITGNYFFQIQQVLMGTTELEIISTNEREILIKMPAKVTPDIIKVIGLAGTASTKYPINFTGYNLINFDIPATTWGSAFCWGAAKTTDKTAPLTGIYMYINETNLPSTAWNDNWSLGTCGFDFGLPTGAARDFQFKFEYNAQEAWKSGQLNIELKTNTGTQFAYQFKPWENPSFLGDGAVTNGWKTATIELTQFVSSGNTISDISKITDITIWFNTPDGAVEKFNTSFDNFRIISK